MYFQLKTLVLWSKDGRHQRLVHFKPGRLNIIAGASKTGKSAVIPIIDYCLGADKCAIPVGVIRESCGWFGIVVDTIEGEKLLARREPGDQRQTGDMYVLEGEAVDIPQSIEQRNTNTNEVKALLDRLSGLPQMGFDPQSDTAYRSRPSFRDLMAFLFQPQNIIANPNVLFFKADATEHREKLRTIFPFILNAVTATVLAARWEMAELQRSLRRKQRELEATASTAQIWRTEAQAWTEQATELGLLPSGTAIPDAWPDILQLLRTVTRSTSRSARPTSEALDGALDRLENLREEESAAASELSNARQRYNEIRRLQQSSQVYGSALLIQRDRLSLSEWLRSRVAENDDPLASLSPHGGRDLDELLAALESIEIRVRSRPAMSDSLDKERIRLSSEVEEVIQQLNNVREQISALEAESDEAKEALYRLDQVDRFLGRLEQAIVLYDRADDNADLRQDISSLEAKIEELTSEISLRDIQRRLENALRTVTAYAGEIVPKLDCEWPTAPVELVVDELTVKVVQGVRDDFLWEIGSGANWLAYHVAMTLALQRFFLSLPHHPIPAFLVYDQPSQAYFPGRDKGDDDVREPEWRDEDVVAVRKVFRAISDDVNRSEGRLQVVVLDHADEDVWGDIENIFLVEHWRGGKKLIPDDWA